MLATNAFGWSYPAQGPFQASIPKSSSDTGTGTDVIAGRKITVVEPGSVSTYNDFPRFFQTYAGIPAAYPTYNAITFGPAPLPQVVETASVKFGLSSADTNGPTTETGTASKGVLSASDTATTIETASVKVTGLTVVDANGSTTETAGARNQPSVTDVNGSTTETTAVVIAIAAVDANGSTTEAQALVNRTTVTDANGALTETAGATSVIVATDANGPLTETATSVGTSSTADVAVGTDTATPKALVTSADVGAGSDSVTQTYKPTVVDANGTTTETAAFISTASTADVNGSVTESAAVKVALTVTDVNDCAENAGIGSLRVVSDSNNVTTETAAGTPQIISKSDTDVNAGIAESNVLAAKLADVDANGTTTEDQSVYIHIYITVSDSGVASESIQSRSVVGFDAGSTAEAASASSTVSTADTTHGLDSNILVAKNSVVDANSITSEVTGIYQGILVTDACAGFDAGGAIAQFVQVETFVGTDVADTHSTFTSSDVGTVYSQWENAAVTGGILSTADAGGGVETQATSARVGDVDVNAGIIEISSTGTLVAASDSNGITVEVSMMRYTVADTNGTTAEITLGIPSNIISGDFGTVSETQFLRQFIPITTDTNGATVESSSVKIGLPLRDTVITGESTKLVARLYSADQLEGADEAHFIWKHIILSKPGRIMHRTRGEVFKPTTGETEIPGESVYKIAKGTTGKTKRPTRGEIKKPTTGGILK